MTAVGARGALEQRAGGGGPVVLAEPAGDDPHLGVQAVPVHRLAVAAAALGGPGRAPAVDVRDPPVAEPDQVVHRLPQPLAVGGADHVDGAVADRAGHDDHRQPAGELGQVARSGSCGPSRISASHRSCSRLATARRSSRPGVTALSDSS